MQATYDAVAALTDAFCRDHLTGELRDLARAMTAALSRKRPSPLASGQPRTWACGHHRSLLALGDPTVVSTSRTN